MPKKIKAKSRTATKKKGFQFKWWMAVGLVAIVALVGVLVLRFSRAAGYQSYTVKRIGSAYGLTVFMKYNAGREAGLLYTQPTHDGRFQLYRNNAATLTCLRPIASIKNTGPITQDNSYNNVQEEPCV